MTLWELIGVSPSCTVDEMKSAWRKKAKELHPDTNGGDAGKTELFVRAKEVYEKALKMKEQTSAPHFPFSRGNISSITITVDGMTFTIHTEWGQ